RREVPDPALGRGVLDERLQPPTPGLRPLGPGHPVRRVAPVPGCLRLEERPRAPVRPELPLVRRIELRRLALLVGVDSRPIIGAALERRQAGGAHQALLDQLARPPDVDGAPGTARLARREPNRVAVLAQAPAQAVD